MNRRFVWLIALLCATAPILLLEGTSNMRTVETSLNLQTPPGILWKAISDHQALPRHVSILREVTVIAAKEGGVGTIRQCTLRGGRSFHETITAWEEGRRYCYQPNSAEAGFPFTWAQACWTIENTGEGSKLMYRLQYEPRSRLRDIINYPLLRTYGIWRIKKMLKSYDQSR